MIYKTFQKVSNVCQLLDKSKYHKTQTINGVTFTNNGDGTITVNGTATGLCQYRITNSYKKLIGENTNKCLLVGSISANSGTPYYLQLDFLEGNSWSRAALDFGKGVIFTNSDSSTQLLSIIVKSGVTVNNLVFKPQLFDLTEMYGVGHEPTTVAQFRQDFPDEMYDYSPHCFVKSYRTLLKASNVCQLLDKSKYYPTQTNSGITFTNNGDGTITVNGTATNAATYIVKLNIPCKDNHKYLVKGCPSSGGYGLYRITTSVVEDNKYITGFSDGGSGNISNALLGSYVINIAIDIYKGVTVSNSIFKPQLFDLTEMYGAGNEPTTVEQFRQDFPEEMYDYKPYSIIPSYKTSLVCKTKNLFDINRLKGIKDLDVYGNSLKCFRYATTV